MRELNRALEESVRLREEVDRISRHDLKTPISSIVGIPRLLRDSGRLSREDGELLAMVEQAGYRLLGLVNLSLDLFRMEQGSYSFSPGAVDLQEVLGNVVRDLRPQADSLRVALRIEGPRVHARAETLLCYSMFANLVKNALEASPTGGTVTLSLSRSGDEVSGEVRVRVHNAGMVPAAVRARFFDKYSSAGKRGGTGLGTYSARLMARTQRGDIEMQTSEADGTVLTVHLHAAPAPAPREAGAAPMREPAPEPPKSLSVLVVDDDEYTRVVVQRFLPSGTRSATAANGREALRRALAEFARTPQAADPVRVDRDLEAAIPGFLESRRELAGELATALEAGEAERARSIAHKLSGSLALYGFRWAAAQGKMIERRAKARALEGLAAEVAELRRHLAGVKLSFTKEGIGEEQP